MSRSFMVIALAAVFVVALALVSPSTASCAALAQAPAGQARLGAAPPGTHGVPGTPPIMRSEEIEKRISPEEREKLGLPEPTWVAQHGKVHPDVRAVLDTGQMPWVRFKGWEPIGFVGTAYVAVYLRLDEGQAERETAIKQVQSRVLSRLTAAEFAVLLPFKSTPAILGYVNAEGLARLAKDADVTGVGLDDRPVPKRPHDRPEEGSRPGTAQGPPERRGKVEVPVYEALEKSVDGYVEVAVIVTRGPLRPGASWEEYEAREAALHKVQERVLSSLTADEFRVNARSSSLGGYVNASGLAKLDSHPDVTAVAGVGPVGGVPKVTRTRVWR